MLERDVKPKNKRHDTACARTTFRKHNVMTIFVILKSVTEYTTGDRGKGFSFIVSSFFFYCFFLVRSGLNAGWFLVNSHYKRLCSSLCTFETVQEIKNRMICIFKIWYAVSNNNGNCY